MSNFRDNTWELTLEMYRDSDFNPFEHWVKPVVEMEVNGLGTRKFPMGMYRFFDDIGGSYSRDQSTWNLTGQSGEALFIEDTTRSVYTVPKGSMVLQTVYNILIASGVMPSMISLPMHRDKKLGTAVVFDPFKEDSAATKLGIMNHLLNAGAFYALYTTADGRFTTMKIIDRENRRPAVRYGMPPDEPIILNELSDSYNREGWANAVVVSSEDPAAKPRIWAVAQNNDPMSPSSFESLGYWKVKQVKYKTLADKDSAQKLANAQLKAASSLHRVLSYATYPDPERGPKETVYINAEPEDADPINALFSVTNFNTSDIYPTLQSTEFEVSRSEPA